MKKSTLVPVLLFIYLAVVVYLNYPSYVSGELSAIKFFGVIAVTVAVIVGLHFCLKKRDKMRRERENDMENKS